MLEESGGGVEGREECLEEEGVPWAEERETVR